MSRERVLQEGSVSCVKGKRLGKLGLCWRQRMDKVQPGDESVVYSAIQCCMEGPFSRDSGESY